MSETKLLPCPFCGGEANIRPMYDVIGWTKEDEPIEKLRYVAECENEDCWSNPVTNPFDTEQQAIEAWNTRKPMDNIVERLGNISELIRPIGWRLIKQNYRYVQDFDYDEEVHLDNCPLKKYAPDTNVGNNNGWISVKEKLPEEGQRCIVQYNGKPFITTGFYIDIDTFMDGEFSYYRGSGVVAWQPLPSVWKGE